MQVMSKHAVVERRPYTNPAHRTMPFPMLRVLIGSTLTADKFQKTKTLADGYVPDAGTF